MLCFITILLHGLIPWSTGFNDKILYALLVASFVMMAVFACVSFRMAIRLP